METEEKTQEKPKEEQKEEVENREPKRERLYDVTIQITGVKAVSEYGRISAVLIDDESNEYKYQLQKKVEKTSSLNKEGFKLEQHTTEKIEETEVLEHIPEIFLQIQKELNKDSPVEAHISFSRSTYFKETGEKVYNSMYTADVETIYVPAIHDKIKNDDTYGRLLERKQKVEDRKEKELSF